MESRLLSLPPEVLKLVLQHVPLKQRLSCCCLVHSRLHSAAVAATEQLRLGDRWNAVSPEQAQGVMGWLQRYGQQVTRLWLVRFPHEWRHAPTPNLLDLVLCHSGSVQLGPIAGGAPGVLQALTQLTWLACDWVPILDTPAGAEVSDSLSRLVHLQHLRIQPYAAAQRTGYSVGGLSRDTLPRLQQLTFLSVSGLSVRNLAQLSGLTNLKQLDLVVAGGVLAGPASVPGLAFPASLKRLLVGSNIEGGLLSLLPPGLQQLHVIGCRVRGAASFLAGMARLQQLTELNLRCGCSEGGPDWPPPGRAYSALTASSSLVELRLNIDPLAAVWPFVFPATHRLPHLTFLSLHGDWGIEGGLALPAALGPAGVSHLVGCSPNLRSIERIALMHGPHVSELRKLTALDNVCVHLMSGGVPAPYSVSLIGLAAVTQLKSLVVRGHSPVTPQGINLASLLPLTRLTRLTTLRFSLPEPPAVMALDEDWHDTYTSRIAFAKVGPDDPDVWLQLLERCAADPHTQPVALRGVAQQLAQQCGLTATLQQQLSHQQQQLADQTALVSQQQQVISGLQQQLAAQQGAAAEQVAGLQGQLQVLSARLEEVLQRLPSC